MHKNIFVILLLLTCTSKILYSSQVAQNRGVVTDNQFNTNIIKRLLPQSHIRFAAGIDPIAGNTALMHALANGNLNVLNALIAEIETPLFTAARTGSTDAIKMLVNSNTSIDRQDSNGDTALIVSAAYGQASALRALLNAKANPYIRNNHGQTVFDKAKHNPETTKVLDEFMQLQTAAHKKTLQEAAQKIISGTGTLQAQQPASQIIQEFLWQKYATQQFQEPAEAPQPQRGIISRAIASISRFFGLSYA